MPNDPTPTAPVEGRWTARICKCGTIWVGLQQRLVQAEREVLESEDELATELAEERKLTQDLQQRLSELEGLAGDAIMAALDVLPLEGSYRSGYTPSERIDPTVIALPEEWATAAFYIAELHAYIRKLPPVQPTSEGASGG